MRVDKFLKNARIIKRRTVAKEACDLGHVTVNGKPAKAGAELAVGDEVAVRFGQSTMRVKVLSLEDTPGKNRATELYEDLDG